MKAKAPRHILGGVGDVALVETLANTLEVAEAKAFMEGVALDDTVRDVEAQLLDGKLRDALAEA